MSKTVLMTKRQSKSETKEKIEEEIDFHISPDGMHRFFEIYDYSAEDVEACVAFFEQFLQQDLLRFIKARQAIKTFLNAALCAGDDDLRDQRIEALGRVDTFLTDLADFRCRFND
jgi:glycyl-tRNA synthetase beta subunit